MREAAVKALGLLLAILVLLGGRSFATAEDTLVERRLPTAPRNSVPRAAETRPAGAPAEARPDAGGSIDVYFSPGGGATEAIVRELRRAKRRVRVQAYSFTSAPIAKAAA